MSKTWVIYKNINKCQKSVENSKRTHPLRFKTINLTMDQHTEHGSQVVHPRQQTRRIGYILLIAY